MMAFNQGIKMEDNQNTNHPNDIEESHIVIPRVAKDQTMLAITRLTAAQLMENPYIVVGDFFRNMPLNDIQTLVDVIEEGEYGPHFSELLVLAQMLYMGEGLGHQIGSIDQVAERIQTMIGFITITSLAKKGLVEAFYDKFSFDENMKNAVIAKPIL
jgi:hypothetical protein